MPCAATPLMWKETAGGNHRATTASAGSDGGGAGARVPGQGRTAWRPEKTATSSSSNGPAAVPVTVVGWTGSVGSMKQPPEVKPLTPKPELVTALAQADRGRPAWKSMASSTAGSPGRAHWLPQNTWYSTGFEITPPRWSESTGAVDDSAAASSTAATPASTRSTSPSAIASDERTTARTMAGRGVLHRLLSSISVPTKAAAATATRTTSQYHGRATTAVA